MDTRRRSAVGLAGIGLGALCSGIGLALVGSPPVAVGSFLASALVFGIGAVQESRRGTVDRTGGLLSGTVQRVVSTFLLACGALTALLGLATVGIAVGA